VLDLSEIILPLLKERVGVRLGVPEEGGVKTGKYYQKIPPLRSSPYKGDIHRSAGFIRNNTISKVSGFI
jgi:hypothetical protein